MYASNAFKKTNSHKVPGHQGDPKICTSPRLLLLLFLATLLTMGCQQKDDKSQSATRTLRPIDAAGRSVLLVTLDTTRPDRLQPYGAADVETPIMARLAARGTVFERAWAVAPITLVAHTSMLSGLYPFEHGVRNNGMQYVSDSVTTLAETLSEEGFRTSAFVSAAVLERRYGLDQGFEVYDDNLSERRNVSARMVADRIASATVDSARAWLDSLGEEERFFSWVHFYDPHASYSPPPPYRDDYRERLYDGEIAYMDAQLGELLKHPRLLGGDKPPIILVVGDHGESLGEHGEKTHAILAYDSTLHIPFIVTVPDGPAGLRIPENVGQVDIMPTVLGLLDIDPGVDESGSPIEFAGRDLTPLLEGRRTPSNVAYYSETYLPFYTYGWAKLKALHRGKWKFIDAPEPELYDLGRDPRELTSVHSVQSDVAYDLARDLKEWLSQHDAEREASIELDAASMAKLRSLGYLSVGSRGPSTTPEERPNPMKMIEQHVGLERARSLLADGFFAQAERQLESVLRSDPNNLAALIDLVRANEGQDNFDEGVRLAERALELDPQYTQTYMLLARLESQRGNRDRALELLDVARDRDPLNPDLQIQRASLLQRAGKAALAKAALEELIADHPEHPRANITFARFVEEPEDPQAAEQRLRQALERDPFIEQGWLYLGSLLERRGESEEAAVSYRQGLKGRPDDATLHGALGQLLARLGQAEEAEAQLREAIRLSKDQRTEFHVTLGSLLAESGRSEQAQREFNRVLEEDPQHPGARNNAAIALFRSGRAGEARAALEAIVADFPKHADAHNNLAAIAVDEQRWQDALIHSRKTIELAPQLAEAWNNLGIALEETDSLDDSEQAYRQALRITPSYWQASFNLSLLFKNSGRPERAARGLITLLETVPQVAEVYFELGELYAGPLAEPAKARRFWNAFLKRSPEHPKAANVRRRLQDL